MHQLVDNKVSTQPAIEVVGGARDGYLKARHGVDRRTRQSRGPSRR